MISRLTRISLFQTDLYFRAVLERLSPLAFTEDIDD